MEEEEEAVVGILRLRLPMAIATEAAEEGAIGSVGAATTVVEEEGGTGTETEEEEAIHVVEVEEARLRITTEEAETEAEEETGEEGEEEEEVAVVAVLVTGIAEEEEEGGGGGHHQHYRRRNRDISTSHEKSRSRERRRRRTQAECIRRAGGFQKLADSEGHEPIRLFWDGFQWVAKTGAVNAAGGTDAALMNSTRKLRRLYFGNLPLHMGLTESAFQEIVWNEMRNRGFCIDPNSNPVLYVWFAKDKGNYGFVEFATVEETERALTMDGMLCMGIPLKVSRPNDYSTTSSVQTQAMSMMGQQAAALLIGQLTAPMGPPPGMRPLLLSTHKRRVLSDSLCMYTERKRGRECLCTVFCR